MDLVGRMRCIAPNMQELLLILAESFSWIYYRNAINNGSTAPFVKGLSQGIRDGAIQDGDELEIDVAKGLIFNKTKKAQFHGDAVSDRERDIMKAGGRAEYLQKGKQAGLIFSNVQVECTKS